MLKIKVEFELDEEQIKDIFESYDIKFTKKKLADLKRMLKESEIDFAYELNEDMEGILGDFINNEFGE